MRRQFKTHQIILAWFILITCLVYIAGAQVKQDVYAVLARAQAFYTSSQFQESLILLTELEKRIGTDPEQANVLLRTKLYLGLAYMGLNQDDQAKAKFVELCKLDSNYALNPQDYSAKIVALYNEAKVACAPTAPRASTAAAETSIVQSTFVRGEELYEKGQFADALKYFNVVLALEDKHELAKEYAQLAQERLEISTQPGYVEWRLSFDARQYDKAAAAYAKIRADQQPDARGAAKQIESEYQTTLLNLVASWKAACESRELTRLDSIRNEATNIAAGLPFGPFALAQLQPCAPRAASPAAGNKTERASTETASNPPGTPATAPNPTPSAALVKAVDRAKETDFSGTYSGEVSNTTRRMSAKLTIQLREVNGAIYGCSIIERPLGGSGGLRGSITGSDIAFKTESRKYSTQFSGKLQRDETKGTFIVPSTQDSGQFSLKRISSDAPAIGFDPTHCRRN